MDQRVAKLKHFVSLNAAQLLVAEGFDTIRKIRAASDQELMNRMGATQQQVNQLRSLLPPFE